MIAAIFKSLRVVLRWLARGAVFPLVERGWELGFALAGMLLRPSVRRIVPGASERVLVIAPHPDDETLGSGGTIARHVAGGDRVCVLVVTDGGSSRAGGIGRDEMRRLRAMEAMQAVGALGRVELLQLGLPEGSWSPGDLQERLEDLLQREQPAVVYAPSRVDFHPEHLKVARVLARTLHALRDVTHPKIRIYELQVPLTPVLANVAVEVGGWAAKRKAAALGHYKTQQGSFGWVPRHSKYLRRLYRTGDPVEVFWELAAESYSQLTEASVGSTKYRSIRLRPFGDGLAWLVGLGERRQLKGLLRDGATE
ncbi:MAG: PIG-L family deacetylase [Chloroflexota bacterium]|nr:PIG-L family deacetylase [Chloroflexota bacterium]MDQ5865954.1 PIG-L family deacetylase [Chloroflexota bacterium]